MKVAIPFEYGERNDDAWAAGPVKEIKIKDRELERLVESARLSKERYHQARKELDKKMKELGEKGIGLKEFIKELNKFGAASVVLSRIGEVYAMRHSGILDV